MAGSFHVSFEAGRARFFDSFKNGEGNITEYCICACCTKPENKGSFALRNRWKNTSKTESNFAGIGWIYGKKMAKVEGEDLKMIEK